MHLKVWASAIGMAVALAVAPVANADDEPVVEVGVDDRETQGVTEGPRCTFTRAEKMGFLLWLFPPAGAVYTPFACKRDVFDKEVDVDVN